MSLWLPNVFFSEVHVMLGDILYKLLQYIDVFQWLKCWLSYYMRQDKD